MTCIFCGDYDGDRDEHEASARHVLAACNAVLDVARGGFCPYSLDTKSNVIGIDEHAGRIEKCKRPSHKFRLECLREVAEKRRRDIEAENE